MENLAKNLGENMLEIRGLNFAYANGAGMLNNVNLSLKKGEILTILGRNGAGKSTLLGLISGINAPKSGEILVGGVNLSELSARERAKLMGFVAQSEICEYDYTGLEYVTMGRAAHLGIFARPSKDDEDTAREFIKILLAFGYHRKFKILKAKNERHHKNHGRARAQPKKFKS